MDLVAVPAFRDNLLWLWRSPSTGQVLAVDPGDADPVLAALRDRGWGLDLVLVTHHHADHVGGVAELAARTGAQVAGPAAEARVLPPGARTLVPGERLAFGGGEVEVIGVPGHTRGHLAYHLPGPGLLFCGDALFLMGCGRLFEGSAADQWGSLQRLRALPDATLVCCAHEYTLGNARFARTVLPEDPDVAARAAEVEARRARGEGTVPDRLGRERRTNVFLRADEPELARAVGLPGADPVAVLAALRARKDLA